MKLSITGKGDLPKSRSRYLPSLNINKAGTLLTSYSSAKLSFSSIFIDKSGERQIVNYRDFDFPTKANWLENTSLNFDAVLADTRWQEGAEVAMSLAKRNDIPGIIDGEPPLHGTDEAMMAASHVAFSAEGLRAYASKDDLEAGLKFAKQRLNNFIRPRASPGERKRGVGGAGGLGLV